MCLIDISEVYELIHQIIQSKLFKFLLIGGSLYLLSAMLMWLFEKRLYMTSKRAYLFQTIITYTLQFGFNAIWTWGDMEATLIENGIRIARYIPIKVILWYLSQRVFSFWNRVAKNSQIANALTVLCIMAINYVAFDKLIFVNNEKGN